MDAGWTRWLLEQYGFEFVTLRPEDFHAPLGNKVDVVILADVARIPVAGGAGVGADARRVELPGGAKPTGAGAAGRGAGAGGAGEAGRGGVPAGAPPGAQGRGGRGGAPRVVRPEYAYTLTPEDLQAFEKFVRDGGTVVCFNSAYRWAVQQFKLPVKNAADGLKPEDFFLRGSIVEVVTNPAHAVMAGMPDRAAVFVDGSPVFDTLEGFKGTVLAKYADTGSPLLSGYLIGEKYLQGKAAALDLEVDKGHIVLVGFRPQWRGQPFGTFKVLFNAALFHGEVAAKAAGSKGFWMPAAEAAAMEKKQ